MRRISAPHTIAIIIIILLLCAGLVVLIRTLTDSSFSTHDEAAAAPSLIDRKTLDALAVRKGNEVNLEHLAPGVSPPSNTWFSGFALQKQPKPGFFYPGSFRPSDTGFEVSQPRVAASARLIMAPHTPDMVVTIHGADSYRVTYYDELLVTLTYYAADSPLAEVRVSSGLPYIYVTSKRDGLSVSFTGEQTKQEDGTLIDAGGRVFGLNISTDRGSVSVDSNETATFFLLPQAADFAKLVRHASSRVESASVGYTQTASDVTTELRFRTSDGRPTMFARLPHQTSPDAPTPVTYESVLGTIQLSTGTSFSYSVPRLSAVEALDVKDLPPDDKQQIRDQLSKDVAALPPSPEDTYFGGKQLQRTAMLLSVAVQVGDEAAKQTLLERLSADASHWLVPGQTGPQSFQYDPAMRGIVGTKASFGSDTEFNDHHFHYGYFLTAAAMLARYDDGFVRKYGQVVDLLAADIANYKSGEQLPLRRNYDPYAGHSWASGIAPFADGNNQESTSEALNAWSGVALWGAATKNKTLQHEGEWMLSNEYAAAQRYWLLRGDNARMQGYTSPIVSLVWGGKREYATFFSDQANAKLAIQLLPMTPTLQRAGLQLTNAERAGTDVSKQYGDAILMASPDATLKKAQTLPDSAIDDGNSRTYLYAYILTRR